MATKQDMLSKMREADAAGVDLSSPKAFVTHLLGSGEKEAVLWFYKPKSVEFDFGQYEKLRADLKK